MFELADSGSSGGLSLRLSVYLSLSFSSSSHPLLPVCLSPPLPFHLLCDAVPCCVGTGVRDRVASDRARTLSSISSVSSLPPLRPFSSTFPYLLSVYLSFYVSLSLSSSLFRAQLLSFPANEQADRAWASRIAFPSIPRRIHDPTYTFGCTCSRDILSRPVARSQPTCRTADFLLETHSSTPEAVSAIETLHFPHVATIHIATTLL